MTYPDDDDEFDVADYEAMDINYYRIDGYYRDITQHQLWPRIQAEGWTDQYSPDVELYKAQGEIDYGIWPEYMFSNILPTQHAAHTAGWRAVVSGEGFFWKQFDTLGDALDAFRDRNFRGFERLLPDPNNTIDSDYEQVLFAFELARGRQQLT